MRVALFTETFFPATDGVVTRIRHTLEELDQLGDEVFVIAPKYPEGEVEPHAGEFVHRVPGVPFLPYPQIKLAPINPSVGKVLRRFRPDVIHAVNPFILGAGAPFYARRLGVPLVASYHTKVAAYARFYGLGFLREATRWHTRRLHNKAKINLCTSRATMDYLRSEGVKRVRLWPQGVDGELFNPKKATSEWREKLSAGEPEDNVLLFVGRLAPEKGIERLKVILKHVPKTRLAIIGDGPARPFLEERFGGERVVFTGTLHGEDLASAYASADAFLFPSTTETLGLAMIEALASGLPVVAAKGGPAEEVVEDGVDGLLYDPSDEASLVSVVRRMFEERGLREEMGRGARAAAERRDWAASTRTVRECYEEALGRR